MEEPSLNAASLEITTSSSKLLFSITTKAVHIFVKLAIGNCACALLPDKSRPVSASITAYDASADFVTEKYIANEQIRTNNNLTTGFKKPLL